MKGNIMREQIIKELVALLQDNVGQRITVALATGIATQINGAIAQLEAAVPAPEEVVQAVTPEE